MPRILFFIVITALIVGVAGRVDAETPRTISMSGTASISVKPDIIRITAGVMAQDSKAADAFRGMSDQLNEVADVLSREGIESEDIQTSDLTLGERYGRGNNEISGYVASSALTVVVRDLDRAGDIVDILVSRGVNQIRGFAFDISDPSEELEAARLEAIRDAIAKTTLYTDAAQVKVGDILSIVENAGHVNRPQATFETADLRSVSIAAGTLSVTANVQVVTEIK